MNPLNHKRCLSDPNYIIPPRPIHICIKTQNNLISNGIGKSNDSSTARVVGGLDTRNRNEDSFGASPSDHLQQPFRTHNSNGTACIYSHFDWSYYRDGPSHARSIARSI